MSTKLVEMFSLMGNCYSWARQHKQPGRKITLLILGLDNAGKTTTIKSVKGENREDVAPTVGFSHVQFRMGSFDVTMFDLGGSKNIRAIWKNYYAEVYGVVYVVDASDVERFAECKTLLHELLKQPRISGKPILVLANKQDQDAAVDEIDLCDKLQLEELVNNYRSPCRVERCSALIGRGKKIDKSIKHGFVWLVKTIKQNFDKLQLRVEEEMEEQRVVSEKEKQERQERVRKIREEREKLESDKEGNGAAEERGSPDEGYHDGAEPENEQNPFVPLQQWAASLDTKDKSHKLKSKRKKKDEKGGAALQDDVETRHQTVVERLDTNTQQQHYNHNQPNADNGEMEDQLVSYRSENASPRPLPPLPLFPNSRQPAMLEPVDRDSAHKKRKKKKGKRNKLAPYPAEEEGDVSNPAPHPHAVWSTPPGERRMTVELQTEDQFDSHLEPASANSSAEYNSYPVGGTAPFLRAQRLPSISPRQRPNMDDEDNIVI